MWTISLNWMGGPGEKPPGSRGLPSLFGENAMADAWFVKLADTEQGPLSPSQLRELVRKKVVKPETHVRKGENRWVRAGKVHGLFESAFLPSASSSGIRPAPEPEPEPETPSKRQAEARKSTVHRTSDEPSGPSPLSALGLHEGLAPTGEEGRVWTGLTDEEEPSDSEIGPVIDLGFSIDEPTSLRDAPRPPLPVEPPAHARPKPVEKPPETPSPPPSEAETVAPTSTDEAPAMPLGLQVEEPASLRDVPKIPKPPPAEAQAPRSSAETEGPESGDRAVRRAYIGRESSVASMGLLLFFQAVLMLLFTGFWTARILEWVQDLRPGPQLRTLQVSVLLEGSALLGVTVALFLMGAGLRSLLTWGRWVSATLMAEALLAALVALLYLALDQPALLVPLACLLLVVGVFEPAWTLYVLLSEPADVVFSTAYRDLVVRTRGVRRPVSWTTAILFLLEAAALGYLGWSFYRG